jgi:hypothetical protein
MLLELRETLQQAVKDQTQSRLKEVDIKMSELIKNTLKICQNIEQNGQKVVSLVQKPGLTTPTLGGSQKRFNSFGVSGSEGAQDVPCTTAIRSTELEMVRQMELKDQIIAECEIKRPQKARNRTKKK